QEKPDRLAPSPLRASGQGRGADRGRLLDVAFLQQVIPGDLPCIQRRRDPVPAPAALPEDISELLLPLVVAEEGTRHAERVDIPERCGRSVRVEPLWREPNVRPAVPLGSYAEAAPVAIAPRGGA